MSGASARKTERLLNLLICLLSTRQPLSREQIRSAVPQYADAAGQEAFERQFERDKDELREMGVPLVTGSWDPLFSDEPGYRVDREAYALPEVSFAPDELAVLGLASRVWQQASLSRAASLALLKLRAEGVEPAPEPLVGVEPRIRTAEPAFEPLFAATLARRPVVFPYRTATGAVAERHVEPWGVASWHGRWYLVGHDRDRAATRVFRLSRVAGTVRTTGRAGDVVPPPDLDLRAEITRLVSEPARAVATVALRPGRGAALRLRAAEQGAAEQGAAGQGAAGGGTVQPVAGPSAPAGWDVLAVAYADTEVLADELAGLGPDVVALAPDELRSAVVRRLDAVLAAAGAA